MYEADAGGLGGDSFLIMVVLRLIEVAMPISAVELDTDVTGRGIDVYLLIIGKKAGDIVLCLNAPGRDEVQDLRLI